MDIYCTGGWYHKKTLIHFGGFSTQWQLCYLFPIISVIQSQAKKEKSTFEYVLE